MKEGVKEPLEIGPDSDPCDLLDYMSDFIERKRQPTVEVSASRTWFFDPTETNAIRVIHGYINYGTHGFESKFKDVKTRKEKYKREATDLEEIPLYFQLWAPEGASHALMAFQSFQGRSCINLVRLAAVKDFQEKYPGYSISFRKIAPSAAILDDAPVKSVTFINPRRVQDRFDRVLGKSMEEVEYEVSVKARKRGAMISLYKDLRQFVLPTENGVVEFNGEAYEGVKADVKLGSKRRVVGIFGVSADAGLIDVSDNIKRDRSGHPTLESIVAEVNSLMAYFYDATNS